MKMRRRRLYRKQNKSRKIFRSRYVPSRPRLRNRILRTREVKFTVANTAFNADNRIGPAGAGAQANKTYSGVISTPQGTASNQRVGDKIYWRKTVFRVFLDSLTVPLTLPAQNPELALNFNCTPIRLIVWRPRINFALATLHMNALTNIAPADHTKVKVYKDKMIMLGSLAYYTIGNVAVPADSQYPQKRYLKLVVRGKTTLTFQDAQGEATSVDEDRQKYVTFYNVNGIQSVQIFMQRRMYYTDI